MEPYWFVPSADEMVQQGGGVPSCMYLLAALGAVVVALAGALVKLAKLAWEERMGRITDRNDYIAQLRVMDQAVKEKKGASPQ